MKLLILSCATGEGHNSAANALIEAAQRKGCEYILADPLNFRSKNAAKIAANTYNGLIKNVPAVFGAIYGAGALYSSTGLTSPVYWANARYSGKLRAYIEEEGFDAVLCTHLFPMEAITALKKKTDFAVPTYGILTDYTCIPFLRETQLDGYFIPHEALRQELVEQGIPTERIFGTGIPVSARFAERVGHAAAREALGMDADEPVVLIMSGGVGCGNIQALCNELLQQGSEPFAIYVLVGRNTDLQLELEAAYADCGRLHIVPFTREVARYMNASDVMISKPGGLSSTEAAVATIPLVHILAFSGCETKNAAFFSAHGMSVRAENAKEAVCAALELLHNRDKAETMRAAQRENIPPDAADRIIESVTR